MAQFPKPGTLNPKPSTISQDLVLKAGFRLARTMRELLTHRTDFRILGVPRNNYEYCCFGELLIIIVVVFTPKSYSNYEGPDIN